MNRTPVRRAFTSTDDMINEVGEFIFEETDKMDMTEIVKAYSLCCSITKTEESIIFSGLEHLLAKRIRKRMEEIN